MAKFTKGEWECGGNAGIWANGQQIVSILFCIDPKDMFKVCDEEAQANAQLISAAPDLYEACKTIQDARTAFRENGKAPDDEALNKLLDTALAKANGK